MAERGVNKVILIGFMGRDPEIRCSGDGGKVANLSLATSEIWRDRQSGEQKERTEWHRVVLFGKLAEVAREFLRKGAQIYIEGQLRTRNWQDDSGVTRQVTAIMVDQSGTLQMLGGRRGSEQSKPNPLQQPAPHQFATPQSEPAGTNLKKGGGKGRGKAATSTPVQPDSLPSQGEWPPTDDPIPT